MLKVCAGIGSTLLVFVFYFLWAILAPSPNPSVASEVREIMDVALFAIPFIVLGAIAAYIILVFTKRRYGIFVNIAVGIGIAVIVCEIFDKDFSAFSFFATISVVGSILNYLGWRVQNKKVQYGLTAIIPAILVGIYFSVI